MIFGKLKVLEEVREAGRLHYKCLCNCGKLKTIRADNIRAGITLSCGCLGREQASLRLKKLHNAINQTENLPRIY